MDCVSKKEPKPHPRKRTPPKQVPQQNTRCKHEQGKQKQDWSFTAYYVTFNTTTASPFHPGRCTYSSRTDRSQQTNKTTAACQGRDMVSQKKKNRRAGPTSKKGPGPRKKKEKENPISTPQKTKSPPSDWHRIVYMYFPTSSHHHHHPTP